jgi:hypothetical protein
VYEAAKVEVQRISKVSAEVISEKTVKLQKKREKDKIEKAAVKRK